MRHVRVCWEKLAGEIARRDCFRNKARPSSRLASGEQSPSLTWDLHATARFSCHVWRTLFLSFIFLLARSFYSKWKLFASLQYIEKRCLYNLTEYCLMLIVSAVAFDSERRNKKDCNAYFNGVSQPDVFLLSLSLFFSLSPRRYRKSKFTLDKELRACRPNGALERFVWNRWQRSRLCEASTGNCDKDIARRPWPDTPAGYKIRKIECRKKEKYSISSLVLSFG